MRKLHFILLLALSLLPTNAPAASPLILIHHGHLPLILSAPHGGRDPIPDAPPRTNTAAHRFVTSRDENTQELALKLVAELEKRFGAKPYAVIARFDRKYLDANRAARDAYDSPSAKPLFDDYHAALLSACNDVKRQWGRGLLVDLHGQSADKDAVFRGTLNGASVSALLERFGQKALIGPNSLCGHLQHLGYKLLPTDDQKETRYTGGYITQTYGRPELAIDAIQLEFGLNLRAKSRLDRTAADTAAALQTFAHHYLPKSKLPQ